jgi:hypothetical protein
MDGELADGIEIHSPAKRNDCIEMRVRLRSAVMEGELQAANKRFPSSPEVRLDEAV